MFASHIVLLEKDLKKNREAEGTEKATIRKVSFLAVDEASKAIFWPTTARKERTFLAEGRL